MLGIIKKIGYGVTIIILSLLAFFNFFVLMFTVDTILFNNKQIFIFEFPCYWVKEYKDGQLWNQWCDIRPTVYLFGNYKMNLPMTDEDQIGKSLLYFRQVFVGEKDIDYKPLQK